VNTPSLSLLIYFATLICDIHKDVLFAIAIKERTENTEEALDMIIAEFYGLQIRDLVYTSLQKARENKEDETNI
jgi:hypothetical protein